ncbi:MAG: tetratricopeptide repeat protein [bacterium]|nr:tetratricopeptide repeat protein [bacterium]
MSGNTARWLLLLALLLCSSAGQAQEAKGDTVRVSPPESVFTNPAGRHVQTRDNSESAMARRLLTLQRRLRRDPDGVLAELERFREQHPNNPQLLFLLARTYRVTGDYESGERILRSLMLRFPEASGYRSELLHMLFLAGKESEAMAMLAPLLSGQVIDSVRYEQAAELLQQVGRYDLVLDIFRSGLEALPQDRQRDRQRLLRSYLDQLSLAGRSRELLITLATELENFTNETMIARVLLQGERLLEEVENPGELIAIADSLTIDNSSGLLSGALRHLYLAVGDFDTYSTRVLQTRIDPRRRPEWLYNEAVRCLEEKQGLPENRRAAAERVFLAILEHDRAPDTLKSRTRLQLVSMALDTDGEKRLRGENPGADDVTALRLDLKNLRSSAIGTALGEQALLVELHLLRDRLGRPAEADSLLRAWFMEPERMHDPHTVRGLELELGENLMALSRFDAAGDHFGYLLESVELDVVALWSKFRLAQLQILAGESIAAQDSLAGLAADHPGGVLANDALDLALLLAESAMWPETVQEFLLGALRLEFSSRPGAAAERLLAFATEFPTDIAAPALLYHAGELLEDALRGEEAVASWLLLADNHADDFRSPQGLELAARLSFRMGNSDRARALLERILNEHPDFPLRPAMRDLQELLEEDSL